MKYVLGIDVGGTKIASALVDEALNLTDLRVQPTSQSDLPNQLLALAQSYDKFEAIGLGLPGQVLKNGTVTRLPNVKRFEKINFKQLLSDKFKVAVSVLNDAKAFALAEAIAGAGKNHRHVAGLILGTGIGAGLVVDKKLYFGKDGLAGEVEHVQFLDKKMLRDYRHDAGEFKIAEDARKYLKTLLDTIVLSWNPDIIVLGGAWSKMPGMEGMANQLTENAGGYETKTPVVVSTLAHAGVIGSAFFVLNQ